MQEETYLLSCWLYSPNSLRWTTVCTSRFPISLPLQLHIGESWIYVDPNPEVWGAQGPGSQPRTVQSGVWLSGTLGFLGFYVALYQLPLVILGLMVSNSRKSSQKLLRVGNPCSPCSRQLCLDVSWCWPVCPPRCTEPTSVLGSLWSPFPELITAASTRASTLLKLWTSAPSIGYVPNRFSPKWAVPKLFLAGVRLWFIADAQIWATDQKEPVTGSMVFAGRVCHALNWGLPLVPKIWFGIIHQGWCSFCSTVPCVPGVWDAPVLLEFAHFCVPEFHFKSKAGMEFPNLLHWEFSKRYFSAAANQIQLGYLFCFSLCGKVRWYM